MKYSNEKSRREKEDPAVLLLGGLAFIIFVILFCIIVWSVTHKGGSDIKIDSSSVIVSSETSSSETSVSADVVTPIESSSEEETEELSGVDYNDTSNDMGLKFTAVEDVVTAKDVTNLRSEPSTSQGAATVLAKLRNGETAVRIGKEDTTGWSKLVYNGQIMYASTNYLLVVEQDEE